MNIHNDIIIQQEDNNMKITTFNPLIVSKDAESIISLFEELGFEKDILLSWIQETEELRVPG